MQAGKLKTAYRKVCRNRARGSITVESSIVVPIILFCILWLLQSGITLYSETVELVQQTVWEEFHPAEEFRRLELLENMLDTLGGR